MPYAAVHHLQKDAERKRVARAGHRAVAPRDFSAWFRERVDELPFQDDSRAWSVRLADEMDKEDDAVRGDEIDRTLRRYYDGETTRPRAGSAYNIGWGLHDVGIEWCSGPLGLLAAGHTVEFFQILAVLSGGSAKSRRAALRFAFASFTAIRPVSRGFREWRLRFRREARLAVASAANERPAIKSAWDALKQSSTGARSELKAALPDFRLAVDIVRARTCSEDALVYAALAVVEREASNRNKKDSNIIRDLRRRLYGVKLPGSFA